MVWKLRIRVGKGMDRALLRTKPLCTKCVIGVWLVCSFEAREGEEDTVAFLKALLALHKRVEEEGAEVFLLLGMGRPMRETGKAVKVDLKKVDKLLAEEAKAYVRVRYTEGDHATVRKEGSRSQMQLPRTHVLEKGVAESEQSREFVEKRTYLSPYGHDLRRNPCVHRVLGLQFAMEEGEGKQEGSER